MGKYRALLIVCCFLCALAYAQESVVFHRFTTEQGLSNDYINCLLQDKKGFLWIGTNGLCRYDGSKFLIYKNDPADSFSISDDIITSLSLDERGRLWAGTYWKGLNMFDETAHQFICFKNRQNDKPLLGNNYISSAWHIDSSHIAIAQGDLLMLDIKNRTSLFVRLPKNTWSEKLTKMPRDIFSTNTIFIDHEKKWWLTGEGGVVQYDPLFKKMNLFCLRKDVTDAFKNTSTWDCKEDRNGNMWIASSAGLFEYERASDKFIQHYPSRFLREDCKSQWVRSVLCHEDGTVWFGTDNGLFHYSPVTGKYFVYRNDPGRSSSISNNDITCLYKDRQNILWIGTENGLNALYPHVSAFGVYQNIPGDKHSLQSNMTRESFKDDAGNIWVGTSKALECIDAATHKVSHYLSFDPRLKDPIEYNVMAVLQQDAGSCWVGTWGAGMQLFDLKKRKFIASYAHFSNSSLSISSNHIKSFCKDAAGNLWIATWNGGIDKFDITKKAFEHFNVSNKSGVTTDYVNKVYYDNHTIWATVISGLLKYDSATNKFKAYRITDDTTNVLAAGTAAITADGKGNLWVGSGTGLTKFITRDNRFEKIKFSDGDVVAGICLGNDQSLWLATGNGLKQYDLNTGNIQQYTLKDGLPISYFPQDCYIRQSADGEILVNSNNGLIHFYPGNISRNQAAPAVHFTSVKIENKELNGLGDLNELHELTLKHDQNYITINFAALNFINPLFNKYAYQLSGVDKDWVYSENRNEVIYTNLQPGNYTFKVKASNDAGVWNNKGISLHIHVSAPWWETWWFYMLCAIVVATILYAFYDVRISKLKAIYGMRSNIARDLHDEIGSTLTSINILSKLSGRYIESDHDKVKGMVDEINEQSLQIQQSMGDIVWAINPENDKLETMLARMREFIAHTLEPKNTVIDFKFDEAVTKDSLTMQQRRDFLLIFKEAINNIAKYAECNNVKISLTRQNGNIELMVADDGTGFDTTKITSSNGLKNMKARADALNAMIRIHSVQGEGTVIELKVPVS